MVSEADSAVGSKDGESGERRWAGRAVSDLFPFAPHFMDLSGHRMHYVDEGNPDAPPILMLHGNPTWSFYYRHLIAAFRDTHRVIVPDHIGCGKSDKPQDYPYRLAQHVQNVERLVDRLDLRDVTLVVHDWGGAIGFGLAARQAARFRRFVVLNTAAFSGHLPLRIALCRIPLLGSFVVRTFNGFAGSAVRMACKNRARMTPDVVAGYLAPYRSYRDRIAILRFIQDIPTKPSHPTYDLIQSIDASLQQFRDHPMLICWGERDFCFNESFLQDWSRRFPSAQIHRFKDAGHYVLEDAHERIIPPMQEFVSP